MECAPNRTNAKSAESNSVKLVWQKTRRPPSEACKGREVEGSRGSVFTIFAKCLCVLCV